MEENNDILNKNTHFNVYGIHITLLNTALDEKNPHVCIGWSKLGDLSIFKTKEDLKNHYRKVYTGASKVAVGGNATQIWMFKEAKVGDYVIYFDGKKAHLGVFIGDYQYLDAVSDQDEDYVNNRSVKWLKHIIYNDLPEDYRKSAKAQKSFFKLNNDKALIEQILNTSSIELVDLWNDVSDSSNSEMTKIKDGTNLIVYGTPGCGKSYYVQHTLLKDFSANNCIRTTFFSDYTHTDFVGQILPVIDGDKVTYSFNPGPFTLALKLAIEKPNEKVALIIEEINRGSAPSIFGDIFQLLDRKNGISEYPIINRNIIEYLNKHIKEDKSKLKEIRLPGNLFIYATMNTSDQNVFTLDTAFKRRWEFEKIKNTFCSDHEFKDMYIPGAKATRKEFVEAINSYMLDINDSLNSEDKQIGVYFVDKSLMRKEEDDTLSDENIRKFAYKVLEYLWDDVSKFNRSKWFRSDIKSLDKLIDEYVKNGIEVFSGELQNKFNK